MEGLRMGGEAFGPVCVYAPSGSGGLVAVYTIADPTPEDTPAAGDFIKASNYANGRYTVKLFELSSSSPNGLRTTPYTGSFQSLVIANMVGLDQPDNIPILAPLSVDAVQSSCGAGQNGQGQNKQ